MRYRYLYCVAAILFIVQLVVPVHTTARGSTNNKSELHGVVSSVMGPLISVFNDLVDIDASRARISMEDCDNLLTPGDVEAGDLIEAKGYVKNDSFIAEEITLKGPAMLEGIITAVGGSTITISGQIVDISFVICTKGKLATGKNARVYARNTGFGLIATTVKVD
ncbi:MAG: hypothetical protein ACUBOA_03410 [Candidatus Loosdrechtia sp.]|uniref:hypothetical protein n=1 Tax=Candidatus Loosdrechtia sp. TaxID=3101272 RepID=UPI003A6BD785|nr:MAG: hypothetical protein QY305_05695 [Candidatus Jettenia sp. AMX2]